MGKITINSKISFHRWLVRRCLQRSFRLSTIFVISISLLLVGAVIRGPYIGSDTETFLSSGASFLEILTKQSVSLEELREQRLFPSYFISSIVLSVIYERLGLGAIGVIVFNSILFSLTVCVVFKIWIKIFGVNGITRRATVPICLALGGIYILFGLPDAMLWSYAVLTDIMFLFWVALFLLSTSKALLDKKCTAWVVMFLIAIVAPFIRPTGILLPLLFVLALGVAWSRTDGKKYLVAWGVVILVPTMLVFLVVPWVVIDAVNENRLLYTWLPETLERSVKQSIVFFQKGIVVTTRHEVGVVGDMSYSGVWNSILTRLGYYWIPIRFGERPYSDIHNTVNIVYMVVTFPLFIKGFFFLGRGNVEQRKQLLFLFSVAYGYALLHGVTLISFDWRYQLPAMLPYWILTGCGLYVFSQKRGLFGRRK